MIEVPSFQELATALSAVSMEQDAALIERRLIAAQRMLEDVRTLDLVAVAFGAPAARAAEKVEEAIRGADDRWINGNGPETVRTVAAVSAATSLRSADRAPLAGLAVQSARYMGFECPAVDLEGLADAAARDYAAGGRARNPIPVQPSNYRKLLVGQPSLEGTEAVSALRAMARRFEEVTQFVVDRIDLMDEEIDALWWARKSTSDATGQDWNGMEPLQRAVQASVEVRAFVTTQPPARGTMRVLSGVADQGLSDEGVGLLELTKALGGLGLENAHQAHYLLPCTTAVSTASKFDDVTVANAVALQETGLDLAIEVRLKGLAEQILREEAILSLLPEQ